MTDVQQMVIRKPVAGRKVGRTSTAPSLRSNFKKSDLPFTPSKYGDLSKGHVASSHLELVAKKYEALSNQQSGTLSPSEFLSPEMSTFSEVKTVYGLRQTLKDVLEQKKGDKSTQRHRREMVRVWSREKISVTETRIYSRPPSRQCSVNNSARGSSYNLDFETNDKRPRLVPIKVSGEDRILSNGTGTRLPNSTSAENAEKMEKRSLSIPIKMGSAHDSERYGERLNIDSDLIDSSAIPVVKCDPSISPGSELLSE